MKILLMFPLICLFLLSNLLATTIHVPSQQPTIQAGINTASNFDTILVDTGLYVENINFNGKNIVVGSMFLTTDDTSYIFQTVIDGNQNGSVVRIDNGEDSTAVLCGFTIQNGSNMEGGGIFCDGTSPILKYLFVTDNSAVNDGGGIATMGSSPNIENVTIYSNTADVGAGIYIAESVVSLQNVTLNNNTAYNNGGGLQAHFSELIIDSCTFVNNEAQGGYGGAFNYSNGDDPAGNGVTFQLDITNSIFSTNRAASGGGGLVIAKPFPDSSLVNIDIQHCAFLDNIASNSSGIMIWGNFIDFQLANSKILGNEAERYAGGGGFSRNCRGDIINCLFAFNSAANNGGYWNSGGASVWSEANVNFMNCNFADNTAAYGAGLTVGGGGIASITNCIFWKNNYQQIALDTYNNNGGTLDVNYCDVQDGIDSVYIVDPVSILNWGMGNINSRPLMLDPLNYDFHLSDYSPCIGIGTSIGAPLTDIEGNPRPNPPSSNPDLGAYENSLGTPLQGPDLFIQIDTLNFGQTFTGTSDSLEVSVRNIGNSILNITSVTANPAEYSVSPTSVNIDPGRAVIFLVTFLPPSTGNYPGTLTLISNDPDSSNYEIALLGQCVEAPIISIIPDSLSAELSEGDSTTQMLTIFNTGGSGLNFNIRNVSSGYNYALQFDGIDDYVELMDSIPDMTELTIQAWINYTGSNVGTIFMDATSHSGNDLVFDMDSTGIGIRADKSGAYLNYEDASAITGLNLTNSWYSVTWTMTSTESKIYLNGNLIVTKNESGSNSGYHAANPSIGRWWDEGFYQKYFNGIIDELRIWNVARTLNEIQSDMYRELSGNELGLVGYWRFNEASGNMAFDLTSNNNNGSLQGNPTWIASTAPILTWLFVDPASSTISANDSLDLNVTFDASGLSEGTYEQNILIISNDPNSPEVTIPVSLTVTPSGIEDSFTRIPKKFILFQNYPNPFNPVTHIRFGLPKVSDVKIELYNILGQRVVMLLDERKSAGYHLVDFDANRFATGVYIYRIEAGSTSGQRFVKSKKMLLMK